MNFKEIREELKPLFVKIMSKYAGYTSGHSRGVDWDRYMTKSTEEVEYLCDVTEMLDFLKVVLSDFFEKFKTDFDCKFNDLSFAFKEEEILDLKQTEDVVIAFNKYLNYLLT